ncbi:MAG: ATP-binding protein, partial [Gemmatimonadaceae bacterium]|nr:ATP-binding protein [Acetobacteraceae bacterium]
MTGERRGGEVVGNEVRQRHPKHRDGEREHAAAPRQPFCSRLVTPRPAIIISTNKSIRDWTELLAGDEVLAAAILDRLLHRSNVIN